MTRPGSRRSMRRTRCSRTTSPRSPRRVSRRSGRRSRGTPTGASRSRTPRTRSGRTMSSPSSRSSATGPDMSPGIGVVEMKDGKVKRMWEYLAGSSPASTSTATTSPAASDDEALMTDLNAIWGGTADAAGGRVALRARRDLPRHHRRQDVLGPRGDPGEGRGERRCRLQVRAGLNRDPAGQRRRGLPSVRCRRAHVPGARGLRAQGRQGHRPVGVPGALTTARRRLAKEKT